MSAREIASLFKSERTALAERFYNDENAQTYLSGHSDAADRAILSLIQEEPHLSERIAVIAVGGYGRRELFPFSDLDLLFLLPDDASESELSSIESLLSNLWALGLTVGHSVRKLSDCLEQAKSDITAQTAMLESRLISGNRALYDRYGNAMSSLLDQKLFFRAKFIEQEQRHLKYHESSYALEPNIKESPGGLRDLHILGWVLRSSGFGRTWKEACEKGIISPREKDILQMVTQALYRLRIHIHLKTGRHEDRLIFEVQEDVAKAMSILPIGTRRASEVLMQRYYVNAKTIGQLNSIILRAVKEKLAQAALPEAVPVCPGLVLRGNILDVENPKSFEEYPESILQAFLIQQENPKISQKSSRLYRALFDAHNLMDGAWSENARNKACFLKIIQHPESVWHTLDELNRWGVLGRIIPPFKTIVGQMQHDLFHAYTVDQHTLRSIWHLRNFTRSEHAHEFPLCTQLMTDFKDNWKLVLALLFHDIGKGKGLDHSVAGAEIADQVCRSLAIPDADRADICFWVLEHLTMSQVAQKQDISDPEVIESFAAKVGNMERLTGLYLLTVCDIRATSSKIWNAWKGRLLEDLFYVCAEQLQGKKISRDSVISSRREEALELCGFSDAEQAAINDFWDRFDVSYFMKNSAESITWHAKSLLPHLADSASFVTARPLKEGDYSHEILVYTTDRPELFSRIVSSFQRLNLSVQEARIHTGKGARVLDSFIVTDDGSDSGIEKRLQQFCTQLAEDLDRCVPPFAPVRSRPSRQSRLFPVAPKASLRPDAGGERYLLSVVATDRLGLLASLAALFVRFKADLVTAKISTLGERVEDVFLLKCDSFKDPTFAASFESAVLEVLELPR